ncbi:O-antigen ligase family protein [Microbacterium sp. AGC62]
MTPELILTGVVALFAIVILSVTLLRGALGFLGAAMWTLFPVYGSFLPPGGGLIALTGGLAIIAVIARARSTDRPAGNYVFPIAAILAAGILAREWIDPPQEMQATGLQLAASVLAAGLLGRIGAIVRWKQGFALGLLPGGVVLAIAETLRVLTGGRVHAQEAAFGVNPIVLAQYAAVAALVVVFQIARHSWRWYAWPVFVVATVGLVFSGSRGPLLGLAIAVAYALFRGYGVERAGARRAVRLITLVLLAIVSAVVVAASRFDVSAWLRLDDSDGNASSRIDAWDGALATILQYPLVGAGPGKYFFGGFGIDSGVPTYPHNLWLEAWSEYGVVTFVLMVSAAIVAWRQAAQLGQLFVIFASVAYSLSGSFDTSLVFWMCLTIAGSTGVLKDRDQPVVAEVTDAKSLQRKRRY